MGDTDNDRGANDQYDQRQRALYQNERARLLQRQDELQREAAELIDAKPQIRRGGVIPHRTCA